MYRLLIILFIFINAHAATDQSQVVQTTLPSVVGIFIEKANISPVESSTGGLGAGVVLSQDGYIVTNAHVIKDAQTIVVQASNGSKYYARTIGGDEQTDIALIKIDSPDKFQPIKLGISSNVKIGSQVIAIGSPFGLQQTVTSGIVSSLHRSDLSLRIQDYIQIDAPINPGNSGGALINNQGELIGINTSILTTDRSGKQGSAHNIGIGFALPIDIVMPVAAQLKSHGHVKPGWLGLVNQDLDKNMAKALHTDVEKGVVVNEVQPGSPAALAGLKPLDIITHVDKIAISDFEHFRSIIVVQGPKKMLNLHIIRNGHEQIAHIVTGSPDKSMAEKQTLNAFAGIHVVNHNELNLNGVSTVGLRIIYIDAQSQGALSGLMPNDIILTINGAPTEEISQFKNVLKKLKDVNLVRVLRGERKFYFALTGTPAEKQDQKNSTPQDKV